MKNPLFGTPTPEEWIDACERHEELFGEPPIPNYDSVTVLRNLTTYDEPPEGFPFADYPAYMQRRIDALRNEFADE